MTALGPATTEAAPGVAPSKPDEQLTFDLETSIDGHDFLRIRAAGNREVLVTSQIYLDKRSAEHAISCIVIAVTRGEYVIRDQRTPVAPDA